MCAAVQPWHSTRLLASHACVQLSASDALQAAIIDTHAMLLALLQRRVLPMEFDVLL
jgi:hypothetical protein